MSDSRTASPPSVAESSRSTTSTRRRRKRRPWMAQKNARRVMRQTAERALDVLDVALDIAAASASDAGVPALSSALAALREVVRKIQTMKTNIEGVDTLEKRVRELKDLVQKCCLRPRGQQFVDIQQRIDALCTTLSKAAEDARGIKSRGIIKRFFTSNSDAERLQGLVENINVAIQDFVTQSVLSIDENVHFVRQDVKAIRMHQEMSLLSKYAEKAQYNSGDSSNVRRECLEGTRMEVLADAYSWIHQSSEEVATCTAEEKSGHFLWINGWAGTGKTTIACSIARKYSDQGTLAANFFCSRSDAQCRDPKYIFVTIARQLCLYHEPFMEKVMAVLQKTPDIINANPHDQFKTLILQPLRELKGMFPTCVIVIDALDECQNEGLTSVVLDILARYIRELAPFLFVVTSRPEPHITAFFEKANEVSLKDSTKPLVLHNMYLESVQDDIRRYLTDGFGEIRRAFAVEADWPSSQDVDRLTELSKGLFIFAATVLRFIGDTDSSNPKKQLQALLTASVSVMHDLYREVLRLAYKSVDTLHQANPSLRRVLGAITLAEEPLSALALADLLCMSESDVRNTLSRLRSVLHIPEEGSEDAVRFIHPTFPEFLLDTSLAKPEAFRVVPTEHHLTLFTQSIAAMDSLRRNIAGIEEPAAFKSEMAELPGIAKKYIPAHVAYACRFWGVHLSHCTGETLTKESRDLLGSFLTCRILYWLEACSLLRVLDGALAALEIMRSTCQDLGEPFADLVTLLADSHRFLWTYYYCIDIAPLQVYHSALAFSPIKSLVRSAYAPELHTSPVVRSGALSDWPPRRDAFTGHGGKVVTSVAFPPSGDCFITGGVDCKVKMWKTSTRTMVRSFDGHRRSVLCVAFSPDGVHIASGSGDQDVRVWEAPSGECVRTFKGHTDSVYSVVYSADGSLLLSVAKEGEVKLWDTFNGYCVLTLEKTGNDTWQAGLSPDGGVIVRGSGASWSMCNVSSATDETFDFSDEVAACTFSHDGHYVAMRSVHVIQVRNCAEKSLLRFIGMRETLTGRLAFSHDDIYIGCGSEDGAVYLWGVASDDPPLVLQAHIARVQHITWNPSDLQVASASDDGTIRVCDFTTSLVHAEGSPASQPHSVSSGPPRFALAHLEGDTVLLQLPSADAAPLLTPENAPALTPFANMVDACNAVLQVTNNISRVARTRAWALITGRQHVDFSATANSNQPMCISPDGLLLAYRSPTSLVVVEVCDLRNGKIITWLTGHDSYILSLTFSPDGTLIATGSKDSSVKVWNATTGDIVLSYEEHTDWVRALAFSSDGSLVATGSDDNSVHVFEVATGRVQQVFNKHRDWVMEVVFAAEDGYVIALDYYDRIYVWDMATGKRVFGMSLQDDSWIHSLDFSADGTAILTRGRREVRMLFPRTRGPPAWPVYAVSKQGWVHAKSPGQTVRLCWLSPEWRALPAWDGSHFHCLDPERKTIVTVDVSRDPEYVRVWGTGV